MGGVKVNTWGETNVAGLFAAGETACTGVHGANRLASNSLLEVLVFSKRILERTLDTEVISDSTIDSIDHMHLPSRELPRDVPVLNLLNLQTLLWEKVGIVRNLESLYEAALVLAAWHNTLPAPTDRLSYELNTMVINARLMTESALLRKESRGAHYRLDFPRSSPTWEKHIVFQL
jgi:L-aspartate oxidase